MDVAVAVVDVAEMLVDCGDDDVGDVGDVAIDDGTSSLPSPVTSPTSSTTSPSSALLLSSTATSSSPPSTTQPYLIRTSAGAGVQCDD